MLFCTVTPVYNVVPVKGDVLKLYSNGPTPVNANNVTVPLLKPQVAWVGEAVPDTPIGNDIVNIDDSVVQVFGAMLPSETRILTVPGVNVV